MEKFVFYDLETTGISPAFDQPLQFAAIVTDLELNEIERVDIRCQLSPHILPSPKALAVTGVRPSQLENNNLPSAFEFAQTIQKFTEQWAPAIWIGYNSIAFDECYVAANVLPKPSTKYFCDAVSRQYQIGCHENDLRRAC